MPIPGNQSLDIVIPSFRLDEDILLAIIRLPKPENFDVAIYIVSDNPRVAVPQTLLQLAAQGEIMLLINETNIGFSASRNRGIRAGTGDWILLLDDDVKVEQDLLTNYAAAILNHSTTIGFAGVTKFPRPFNAATKALKLGGITSHFESALYSKTVMWAPTANLVLNRIKMDAQLFDESLKAGGEDIEFLVRNSLMYNDKYVCVADAIVTHPWWDKGNIQTRRLFRYGVGASEIACKEAIKKYTYRDFTNTSETIFILLVLLPVGLAFEKERLFFQLMVTVIIAEIMTNYIKAIITGKNASLLIGLHLTWIKFCRETGYLYATFSKGHIGGFAQRIDMGFSKPYPGPFRLNRWKIIKTVLILIGVMLAVAV